MYCAGEAGEGGMLLPAHCAACQGFSIACSLGAQAVLATITDLSVLLVAPVMLSRHLM